MSDLRADLLAALEDPAPRRASPNQREHRFQGWTDRLLDRIILPPCFITAVDQAGQDTDSARARMMGRGAKFGLPDHWAFQAAPNVACAWELKVGHNIPTPRQEVRMAALRAAGVFAGAAWDLHDVLAIAREAGFRLHGNAENICVELTARWKADERKRESGPAVKRSSKPRAPRATKGALRVGRAFSTR